MGHMKGPRSEILRDGELGLSWHAARAAVTPQGLLWPTAATTTLRLPAIPGGFAGLPLICPAYAGPLPKTCRRAHLQMVPAWGTEHEAQLERHASSTAVPAQRESEPHVQYRRAYESELVMHVRN